MHMEPCVIELVIADHFKRETLCVSLLHQTGTQPKPAWVTADQRIRVQKLPAQGPHYQSTGSAPDTHDAHTTAFCFLVQVVLFSHVSPSSP